MTLKKILPALALLTLPVIAQARLSSTGRGHA